MKDENIRKLWEEFINDSKYQEYFISQYDKFVLDLNKLKIYIDKNKKKPTHCCKDKDVKSIGYWISNTQKHYITKTEKMKYDNIRKLWEDFINDEKYKIYFN